MKQQLLAYQISGQTIGIDIETWNDVDLNGNKAFLAIDDGASIPTGYTDISSIINWGFFGSSTCCPTTGNDLELSEMYIRQQIKELLTHAQLTGNTSGLTAQEIEIVKDYKLDSFYQLYEYFEHLPEGTDVQATPVDLEYNILGLHKKRYFTKGELNKVEYYGNYDFATDTYSMLVLHEDRIYHRMNEMVYKRELDICWHLNDASSGATKHTEKFYTQSESFAVGERRRRNCITNLKIETVGLIMMASGVTQQEAEQIGWSFLEEFNTEITVYIEGAEEQLKTGIMTTTNHDWLDWDIPGAGATVRQYLYNGINIDYTENNTYV